MNYTLDQIPQTSFKIYAHPKQTRKKQSSSTDRKRSLRKRYLADKPTPFSRFTDPCMNTRITRSAKRKGFTRNDRERQNRIIKYRQMYQILTEDLEALADLESPTDSVSYDEHLNEYLCNVLDTSGVARAWHALAPPGHRRKVF